LRLPVFFYQFGLPSYTRRPAPGTNDFDLFNRRRQLWEFLVFGSSAFLCPWPFALLARCTGDSFQLWICCSFSGWCNSIRPSSSWSSARVLDIARFLGRYSTPLSKRQLATDNGLLNDSWARRLIAVLRNLPWTEFRTRKHIWSNESSVCLLPAPTPSLDYQVGIDIRTTHSLLLFARD
jgi:hypothetical protein